MSKPRLLKSLHLKQLFGLLTKSRLFYFGNYQSLPLFEFATVLEALNNKGKKFSF